jgi:hypothetical protein
MVNLEKITSRKGAKVEFHFETEEDHENLLQEDYSQKSLQNQVRNQIDDEIVDTGKGTVIHLLINTHGKGKSMNATEYAEWQSKEDKDWYHNDDEDDSRSFEELLEALLPVLLGSGLLGDHKGMPMIAAGMRGHGDADANEFVGPTMEEFMDISSDDENIPRVMAMQESAKPEDKCKFCPAPTELCHKRSASFDYEGVKKALKENDPSLN